MARKFNPRAQSSKISAPLPHPDSLVTRRFAAGYLLVGEKTIDRLIKAHKLPAFCPAGRSVRIRMSDLQRLVVGSPKGTT